MAAMRDLYLASRVMTISNGSWACKTLNAHHTDVVYV